MICQTTSAACETPELSTLLAAANETRSIITITDDNGVAGVIIGRELWEQLEPWIEHIDDVTATITSPQ